MNYLHILFYVFCKIANCKDFMSVTAYKAFVTCRYA